MDIEFDVDLKTWMEWANEHAESRHASGFTRPRHSALLYGVTEMDNADLMIIVNMLEKYGVEEMTSALSYACSEKAIHIAESEGSPIDAKDWMWRSIQIDDLTERLEIGRLGRHGRE